MSKKAILVNRFHYRNESLKRFKYEENHPYTEPEIDIKSDHRKSAWKQAMKKSEDRGD
jgi:hypothetical protein